MNIKIYDVRIESPIRYCFTSRGKKGDIIKLAEFTPTTTPGLYNFSFGDRNSNGEMDDASSSDNGDMKKVLATIISILYDFTGKYAGAKIIFIGHDRVRRLLYGRIIRTYYLEFRISFSITGILVDNDCYAELPFTPILIDEFIAYCIIRKT